MVDKIEDRPESVTEQQKIINDWRRMVEDEKLKNKTFTQARQDELSLSDVANIANSISAVTKSEKFDFSEAFANSKFRQAFLDAHIQLTQAVKEAHPEGNLEQGLKQAIKKASLFSTLDEGYFGHNESLQFA